MLISDFSLRRASYIGEFNALGRYFLMSAFGDISRAIA